MLTALVEHGHDHADAAGLAVGGGDDPLQVGKMIIRTQGNVHPVHLVGDVVGAGITENEKIIAADAFLDHSLALAVTEAGAVDLDQEIFALETGRCPEFIPQGFLRVITPLLQPAVHFFAHCLCAGHGNKPKRANRVGQERVGVPGTNKIRHAVLPSVPLLGVTKTL